VGPCEKSSGFFSFPFSVPWDWQRDIFCFYVSPSRFLPIAIPMKTSPFIATSPIPAQADRVLQDTQRRLDLCPLYAGHPRENIFLCDHFWRYELLTNLHSNAGGNAYGFAPENAFLRKADIALNVLFRKDGRTPSGPDRPLSYFMAHEITHGLTARFLGFWAASHLPVWKSEGYADYVGKGGDFDFKENLALFKQGDSALDPKASGLYLRYHLLVAELLDRRNLTVEEMLKGDFDRVKLEADLRAD
jgi:hypothetical protein